MKPLSLSMLFIASHCYFACATTGSETDVQVLFKEIKHLYCLQSDLQEEVDRLWTDLAATMDESLPSTMPYQERINMVSVRNADLIRMFDAYDTLDQDIQSLVDSVESADQRIVEEFSSIQDRLKVLEQKRMALFADIEKQSPARLQNVRAEFTNILGANCEHAMENYSD